MAEAAGPEAGPSHHRSARDDVLYASQPEIIRGAQKDEVHIKDLQDLVENVFRGVVGPRRWQQWATEVKLGTKLLYFSLTTLAGSQTLGEEYVDILQSGLRKQRVSKKRQTGMVALHIMVPYLAAYLYTRFRRHARQQQQQQQENPSSTATQTRWQRLALWSLNLPAFDSLMQDHVRPLHLALFFLMGRYYSLSKRWFQIRYVSTRPPANPQFQPPSYEVLGVLMAVQLLTKAGMSIYRRAYSASSASTETEATQSIVDGSEKPKERPQQRQILVDGKPLDQVQFDPEAPDQDDEEIEDEAYGSDEGEAAADEEDHKRVPRCMLCLSKRRVPTCTECGHVCESDLLHFVRFKDTIQELKRPP